MLKIEFNCNDDTITLFENNMEIQIIKVKYPNDFIDFFSEFINRIEPKDKLGIVQYDYLGIELVKIDEDRFSLEEW